MKNVDQVTVFIAKLFSFCLVHQITRKVIRKYVSADGMETQEVTIEGSHQETVEIEEGDTVSRVVKRTVLHSEGDQKEVSVVYRLLSYGFIAAPLITHTHNYITWFQLVSYT